jgi:hypothetical protein
MSFTRGKEVAHKSQRYLQGFHVKVHMPLYVVLVINKGIRSIVNQKFSYGSEQESQDLI